MTAQDAWILEARPAAGVGLDDAWKPLAGVGAGSRAVCEADLREFANAPEERGRMFRIRNVRTGEIVNGPVRGAKLN